MRIYLILEAFALGRHPSKCVPLAGSACQPGRDSWLAEAVVMDVFGGATGLVTQVFRAPVYTYDGRG